MATIVIGNKDYSELSRGLNQLEHLCQGAIDGFYNDKMLRDSKGAQIVKLWATCSVYLIERQKIHKEKMQGSEIVKNDSNVPFSAIEHFAKKWR